MLSVLCSVRRIVNYFLKDLTELEVKVLFALLSCRSDEEDDSSVDISWIMLWVGLEDARPVWAAIQKLIEKGVIRKKAYRSDGETLVRVNFSTPIHRKMLNRLMADEDLSELKEDEKLNVQQAADFLGVKKQTLDCWRSKKRYDLAYIKVGRVVRYLKSELIRFQESCTIRPNRES